MIVDVHTHVFDPATDFGPRLRADLARCGGDPAAWGNVKERHLATTQAADVAVVFGLQAAATGWKVLKLRATYSGACVSAAGR